ncbi:hypothetical protein Dimus_012758 [Dionaea muscipula]
MSNDQYKQLQPKAPPKGNVITSSYRWEHDLNILIMFSTQSLRKHWLNQILVPDHNPQLRYQFLFLPCPGTKLPDHGPPMDTATTVQQDNCSPSRHPHSPSNFPIN